MIKVIVPILVLVMAGLMVALSLEAITLGVSVYTAMSLLVLALLALVGIVFVFVEEHKNLKFARRILNKSEK